MHSPPTSSPHHASSSTGFHPGDGFTADEIEVVLHPPSAQWTPTQDYEECDIGNLEPGPRCIAFMGRIVNFYVQLSPSKKPAAAKGCLKMMVADDTGAVTVRLWYASPYTVRLGQLVTVWTVHVSNSEHNSLALSTAPLFTSIFPERERSCHIMIHENSDNGTMCKKPFRCEDSEQLAGLMTVKSFTDGGYDVDSCKVLVCVKSIGAKKKFTNKKGITSELINIGVFDDTAEASLTLYGPMCTSASTWQPSHTVLLISNPGWRIDRIAKLSLAANTRVDIDPEMSDALWLRSLAQRLTKKEHVNPPFPDGVFDTAAAETAAVRILYTLADIDEFARANPKERFMGYISVLITELNIVTIYRRRMLMCTECCGIPLFANTTSAICKQCNKTIPLRINPKILGPLLDETGQIASGKLIFSPDAWTQLLGRTAEQLAETDIDVLRYLEHRLQFLRVSLGFGWCLEGTEPEPGPEVDRDGVGGGGNGDEALSGRKRKRVDVLGRKGAEKEKENGALVPTAHGNRTDKLILASLDNRKLTIQAEKKGSRTDVGAVGDGIGEVGRLCIWCVKM
ncbi:hypothetical protein P154DRAFT_501038 [Amniculicola lignicola CBS 123094]|uniref:Nucleic acid-binding protein n=1 Tax=Amniculicola lignicola CBS 123094 TaxID=1392246 RepID=A0A6A5VYW8_9PLEO|nr:hypothetical protein P154DRAFT_501038 [Amniculicola lignicola CBS 123094]